MTSGKRGTGKLARARAKVRAKKSATSVETPSLDLTTAVVLLARKYGAGLVASRCPLHAVYDPGPEAEPAP
ncbi:MAG TPA: hypothetical protein VIK91_16695 [Nannocystis sp.]